MSRYHDEERTRLEIAHAIAQGRDVVEHLRQQHRARGWTTPTEDGDA